jgi:hypothetical protein
MHDFTLALAYIGAYALGIATVVGIIAYVLKHDKVENIDESDMAMAEAVGVVAKGMPGSTVLDYSGTQPGQ